MSKSSKITICLISSVLVLFLAFVPLFSSTYSVRADTNYSYKTFDSSNLFVPITNNDSDLPLNFSWSTKILNVDELHLFLDLKVGDRQLTYNASNHIVNQTTGIDLYDNYSNLTYNDGIFLHLFTEGQTGNFSQIISVEIVPINGFIDNYSFTIDIPLDMAFLYDLSYVTFSGRSNTNTIHYYDYSEVSDGIIFRFPSMSLFDNRTYYFNVDYDSEDLNQAYKNGLSVGKQQGYEDGKKDGFLLGLNDVSNNELNYNKGFNDGISHADEYTFFNLISSVIDVPVKTLTSLLNFEFMGINLLQLFGCLVSGSVFLLIIRFIF